MQTDLERIARVSYVREMAIISLICNLERTSEILERVFRVLKREGINVKMMSQVRSQCLLNSRGIAHDIHWWLYSCPCVHSLQLQGESQACTASFVVMSPASSCR